MGCDLPRKNGVLDNDRLDEIFGRMPELPLPSIRRFTMRNKAAIVEAVHGGWVPIEEYVRRM
jgi:hypothetical protein